MKAKLLIIMVLGFGAIASYGFLEFNNVDLDLQSLGVINSVESFTAGFNCACSDSEGGFDMGNCNVQYLVEPSDGPDGVPGTIDDIIGVPHPDSLGLVGNMLCLWESHGEDYGGLINSDSEGCESKNWLKIYKNSELYWPAGFSPDYQFNDIFQTTFPYSDYDSVDEREALFAYFKGDKKFLKYFDGEEDFFKNIKNKGKFLKYFKDKDGDQDQFKNEKNFFKYFKNKQGFMKHFDDQDEFFTYIWNNDDFLKHFKNDKSYKHQGFTLEDALKNKGSYSYENGKAKKFAGETTAAILNAAHNEINYPYTVKEVIRMTQDAVVDGDYREITKEFKAYNKLGDSLMCP